MPPHILFLTRTAYTLGGAATWLDYLEPALRARGWRVTVGLMEGRRYHRPEGYLAQHPHQEWMRIACLSNSREGRRAALRQALATLAPDIVVSMNVTDAVAVIAAERALGQPTPRIAMSAQMIDEGLVRDIAEVAHVLDGVLCTNALTRQLAIQMGGMPPARVFYGPYGVPIPARVPDVTPGDRLPICYVGRLDWPDKRVYDIPRILEVLDSHGVPFTLTVIGTGPDEAEFRQRLQPWLANGSARLLGRLAPADIWAQVQPGRGVLLLTSWTDTGPFVVFEAMAWHVAVVSSRYYGSGLERALRHRDTAMLFPIGDATAAAECLRQLWTDRALYQRLLANGATLVRERYALEYSITVWDGIFRAMLAMAPRPLEQATTPPTVPVDALAVALRATASASGAMGGDEHDETDEWPLTLAQVPPDNPHFWAYVAALDTHASSELPGALKASGAIIAGHAARPPDSCS